MADDGFFDVASTGRYELSRLARSLAADVNVKRRAKGLLLRAVGSLYILLVFGFEISISRNLQRVTGITGIMFGLLLALQTVKEDHIFVIADLFRSLPFTCSMGMDSHQGAFRVFSDFRKGKFGWIALESPPDDVLLGRLGGRQVVRL
ncbi:hypothetical protein EV1_030874 [Malus domestica]